jgi:3-dehydroquinate dehydratase-2
VILRNRIDVLHGVNLDQLGVREPAHYGTLTLDELNAKVEADAQALGLTVSVFQTNHEGELVERIHRARELADGIILNAGAWTHYAWSLHDALLIADVPVVEVHLSDVMAREEWRRTSVVRDVCIATISGQGADGYREALALLADRLSTDEESA